MIHNRGGLCVLGLDGLLARMCLWIDFNASHLYNVPVRFTEAIPLPIDLSLLLDPASFLAVLS